jgi:YHS domain-containing protein
MRIKCGVDRDEPWEQTGLPGRGVSGMLMNRRAPMATEIKGRKAADIDQIDPVCGMRVSSAKAFKTTEHGKDYYFCSEECQEKFQADPEAFRGPDLD